MRVALEQLEADIRELRGAEGRSDASPADPEAPHIDWRACAVEFQGRRCPLRGLSLKLFARVARRPGRFVSRETLIEDVWQGRAVSDDAVRQAIRRLRQQLRDGGLADLAEAIVAPQPGFYALGPIWRIEQAPENVTEKSQKCRAPRHSARVCS